MKLFNEDGTEYECPKCKSKEFRQLQDWVHTNDLGDDVFSQRAVCLKCSFIVLIGGYVI